MVGFPTREKMTKTTIISTLRTRMQGVQPAVGTPHTVRNRFSQTRTVKTKIPHASTAVSLTSHIGSSYAIHQSPAQKRATTPIPPTHVYYGSWMTRRQFRHPTSEFSSARRTCRRTNQHTKTTTPRATHTYALQDLAAPVSKRVVGRKKKENNAYIRWPV